VPLALELAAGQLRRFDLDELNRRLGERLTLLSGRAPGGGQRHATMESAIDWSYQLLDATEQFLLRQLGVFPSSFDVTAVEASALETPDGPVPVLGQLVDKSLVVRVPGSGRYRLLETIRMFARDRLDEAGETAPAFERHRRQMRDRLATSSRLDRWMSARMAAAFHAGLDDARQAFRLSLDRHDVHDAVEIAIGASFLWRNARHCAESQGWVDDLLAAEVRPEDQVWVQILRADIGLGRGDQRQMFAAAAAATSLLKGVDDQVAASLAAYFAALEHLVDPHRGPERLGAAVALARGADDPRPVVLLEAYLAVAHLAAGRYDDARAALARLDRSSSEDGYDRFSVNWAGWMLGLAERDGAVARRWMDQQQDFLDRTGIVETWMSSFSTAMCDVIDDGDVGTTLRRTLALADREGYRADADCLLVLAYADIGAGRHDSAAELVGAARHGRFNATAHYALYRAVLDRALQQEMDRGRLITAMARGRRRKPAEVLAGYGITR
jgi:tetratricopeptide (TPR) repeat protein